MQPLLDAGVVGLQVVDQRAQASTRRRSPPSRRRCRCAGWWGSGPRWPSGTPRCSGVELGHDGDLFLGHLAVDDSVRPELHGTVVIPVLACARPARSGRSAPSPGRCRCGWGRPRSRCASGRPPPAPRRARPSPCRARAGRWSRTRRTSGCPAALTISTNRSGRSLPSGPATMPHASSGWSRLACATIASYVAWSMVSTVQPRRADPRRAHIDHDVGVAQGSRRPAPRPASPGGSPPTRRCRAPGPAGRRRAASASTPRRPPRRRAGWRARAAGR